MIQNQYHCLIAGLPELSLTSGNDIAGFREMLKAELHPDDYELVKLVFLKQDNENLPEFLISGKINDEKKGNFGLEDFREQYNLLSEISPDADILPPYMIEVMQAFYNDGEKTDKITCSNLLAEKYLAYIQSFGSNFLKAYTGFEYDLENLRSYIEAGKHDMDPSRYIHGNSNLAAHLRKSTTAIPAKDPEYDLFDRVTELSEIPSLAEREYKFDQLRWQVIEEMIFFEDFSIDWILGYLHMLIMANRWGNLDHEKGEQRLRNIIRGIKERNLENILSGG